MAFNYGEDEYKNLISEFEKQNAKKVAAANASAQGEAQRRGLVGQTGTSDIEMALRGARTAPLVEAGQGQVAQLLQQMADQRLQDQRTQQQQGYQTSERLGTQGWQSGENQAQRGWQTGEREGSQQFQGQMAGYIDPNTGKWVNTAGEGKTGFGDYGSGLQQQSYDEMMANRQRQWRAEDEAAAAKRKKKGMWGDIGAAVVGGAVGGFTGGLGTGVGYGLGNKMFNKTA